MSKEWETHIRQNGQDVVYMPTNDNLRPVRDQYFLHIWKANIKDRKYYLRFGSSIRTPTPSETIGIFTSLKSAKVAYKIYAASHP
jgi:hypothetical protein